MKWPWVSRMAYDLIVEERDRLRAKNDSWEDHVRRTDRKEKGMTELPAQKKAPPEPIPPDLAYVIDKFSSETTRQLLRNQARIAHSREGKKWSEIRAELEASLG
tara:strand:- start:3660 stop:3971 length:312 start_codon:yes stop_codon:yes gene_type:complete